MIKVIHSLLILTEASLSKRANSSLSSFTSSCALQAEDNWVKPTMSANSILKQKGIYRGETAWPPAYIFHLQKSQLLCSIKVDFVIQTWRFHGGTCTWCWTAAAAGPRSDWPGSSCPAASHLQYASAGWRATVPPTLGGKGKVCVFN